MIRVASLLWLSITIAFLSLLRYFLMVTDFWNRLELAWSVSDYFSLVVILFLVGSVLTAGGLGLMKAVPKKKNQHRLFLIALFVLLWPALDSFSLVRSFFVSPSMLTLKGEEFLKLVVIVLFGILVLKKPTSTKTKIVIFLLIFSPTVVIFFIRSIFFLTIPRSFESQLTGNEVSDQKSPPILYFLFDEWSYGRTFVNGQPLVSFPNVARLVNQSIVFHRALSPGVTTNDSLPYLLGQNMTRQDYRIKNNIFQTAHSNHWNSAIVGTHLPYAYWFKNEVDACIQASSYKVPNPSFLDNLRTHMVLAQLQPLGFWNKKWAKSIYDSHEALVQRARVAFLHEQAIRTFKKIGNKTFSYFHYPIPHPPFIGFVSETKDRNQNISDVEKYHGNIKLTDKILGELMANLKKQGLWEKSLIIITSDHAWKEDPFYDQLEEGNQKGALRRHVPLFVKFPYQSKRRDVYSTMPLTRVKEFLRDVLKGQPYREDKLIPISSSR